MKKISVFLVIVLFAFASSVLAEKAVRIPFQAPPSGMQFVPDEFVVKFQSSVGKENGQGGGSDRYSRN